MPNVIKIFEVKCQQKTFLTGHFVARYSNRITLRWWWGTERKSI